MVFSYSKTIRSYVDFANDRVEDETFDFDYEPEYEDLINALAIVMIDSQHKEPLNDIEFNVCKKVTIEILNEMSDLTELFEAYKDELKDYFEEEAKESV